MPKSRPTVERSTTAWPQRGWSVKVKGRWRVREGATQPQAGQARRVKGNTAEQPIVIRNVRLPLGHGALRSVLSSIIPRLELATA